MITIKRANGKLVSINPRYITDIEEVKFINGDPLGQYKEFRDYNELPKYVTKICHQRGITFKRVYTTTSMQSVLDMISEPVEQNDEQ